MAIGPQRKASIRLVHLFKDYGAHHVHAVRDVSLSVAAGEFVALMGPSGCGKSTLLNLIGAMDQPTEGEIWISDADREVNISTLPEKDLTDFRRSQIGFIFQFFNLLSTLTVEENVALPLDLAAKTKTSERTAKVRAYLELVGLSDRSDFYPAQLSGGEMQRVAIARALIHDPKIILADEPTGNLDSENGQIILNLLQTIATERGKTILMATHSEEAARAAHRVLRMKDGQLLMTAVSAQDREGQ